MIFNIDISFVAIFVLIAIKVECIPSIIRVGKCLKLLFNENIFFKQNIFRIVL